MLVHRIFLITTRVYSRLEVHDYEILDLRWKMECQWIVINIHNAIVKGPIDRVVSELLKRQQWKLSWRRVHSEMSFGDDFARARQNSLCYHGNSVIISHSNPSGLSYGIFSDFLIIYPILLQRFPLSWALNRFLYPLALPKWFLFILILRFLKILKNSVENRFCEAITLSAIFLSLFIRYSTFIYKVIMTRGSLWSFFR